ncbi:hypothetical protein DAEQUDRAFT_731245, partial [Daedalea quercina L-15889]
MYGRQSKDTVSLRPIPSRESFDLRPWISHPFGPSQESSMSARLRATKPPCRQSLTRSRMELTNRTRLPPTRLPATSQGMALILGGVLIQYCSSGTNHCPTHDLQIPASSAHVLR